MRLSIRGGAVAAAEGGTPLFRGGQRLARESKRPVDGCILLDGGILLETHRTSGSPGYANGPRSQTLYIQGESRCWSVLLNAVLGALGLTVHSIFTRCPVFL